MMDRLQKKCVIASAGFHLSLALILVVGPAFLSSKSKSEDMPTLDFVPDKLIDQAFSGGGNPQAHPPPAAPPVQPPQPPARAVASVTPPAPREKVREPEPPKEVTKADKSDPDSVEPVKEARKTRKLDMKFTPVNHKSTTTAKSTENSQDDAREQQLAERRQRMADAIRSAARSLRDDTSPTTIDFTPGHGGGEAYANYGQIVKSIYESEWLPPDDASSDSAIVKATVTIASDGNVVSARIVRSSGDTSTDNSVQRTLDRVHFVAKFPDGSTDKERTYTINFNLKARRQIG